MLHILIFLHYKERACLWRVEHNKPADIQSLKRLFLEVNTLYNVDLSINYIMKCITTFITSINLILKLYYRNNRNVLSLYFKLLSLKLQVKQ